MPFTLRLLVLFTSRYLSIVFFLSLTFFSSIPALYLSFLPHRFAHTFPLPIAFNFSSCLCFYYCFFFLVHLFHFTPPKKFSPPQPLSPLLLFLSFCTFACTSSFKNIKTLNSVKLLAFSSAVYSQQIPTLCFLLTC